MSEQSDSAGTVVVGFDGSAESTEAVAIALREAEQRDAELRMVTAITADWSGQGTPRPDWQDRLCRHSEALQAEALAEAGRAGARAVRVRHVAVVGHPGETLVEQSRGAELLVVGSRGHHALARVLLGSVSTYCLHHAACPVLVVRLHPEHPRTHLPSAELAGHV